MRLLLFNLATDADDPILGFTSCWIAALASRVASVHVITMRSGRLDLPDNVQVFSVGKEKGFSEARRALLFYRYLSEILAHNEIDACFSHMMPLFSAMSGPLLRARHIPLITWFAHPTLSTLLKVAHGFSNRMVSSVASAYPYKQDKLTVIGQGIDTEMFAPEPAAPEEAPALIACAGRLSPVKNHGTLIKAAALLRELTDVPFRVAIIGGSASAKDHAHIKSLQQQVRDLRLQEIVRFEAAVPMTDLVSWYRRCAVHVNLTPRGFGDKVAWEAMSCAKPCLVANDGFRETLGRHADALLFSYGNASHLAERLRWVLSLSAAQRSSIGDYLRNQVVQLHSLDRLTANLLDVFADLKNRSSGLLPGEAKARET